MISNETRAELATLLATFIAQKNCGNHVKATSFRMALQDRLAQLDKL